GMVSFDVGASVETVSEPVWRASLPAGEGEAARLLEDLEAKLAATQAALPAAEGGIDEVVHQKRMVAEGVSFAVPTLTPAEQTLWQLMRELEGEDEVVHYGMVEDGLAAAQQQWSAMANWLEQTLGHYTYVETEVGGQWIGRTTVAWQGDFQTYWSDERMSGEMDLHLRTLRVALSSRNTLLQTISLAAASAAKISLALSMGPAGAIQALPAAWKYINQVRQAWSAHQQVVKENE
ncbi:MAG TPA: hypothetical protein VLL52_08340, partial [Anaerolineae bacterium]|nr:hypothetical protein [Anaerolineae bacterium]